MNPCSAEWRNGELRTGAWTWKPWELVALVGGFLVYWPIGLAVLGWKYFKNRSGGAASPVTFDFRMPSFDWRPRSTGNAAFDEYRAAELERLERERRRLIEEEREFAAFLERLKRARDKEEFDRFMADRRGATAA